MAELDEKTLRCLFSKRYMDFRTCSSLRSVSVQFNCFAAKYCRSLKELDLSVLILRAIVADTRVEKLYTCLVDTVAKNCPNLRKLSGVRICPESLNLASRNCLEGLLYLTSVAFNDFCIEMSILYNFLKRLSHLRSVKVRAIFDEDKKFGNIPEEEKLAVPVLSLEFGNFWRIFRVDCLKQLGGLELQFGYHVEEQEEFTSALARCENLTHLHLEINRDCLQFMNVLSLMRGVEARLKQLTVNIQCIWLEGMYASMRECPFVWQHTQSLEIVGSLRPTGCLSL